MPALAEGSAAGELARVLQAAVGYLFPQLLPSRQQLARPFDPGLVERNDRTTFDQMAARIVEQTPMRRLDARRAALFTRTVEAVFAGTEWLTAEEIGRLRVPDPRNPHAAAARWRREGRIFGVARGGKTYYPRYGLTESLAPHPALTNILSALKGLSDMRVASWFESTNTYLGGRRPREALASDPAAVLAAAQAHATPALHG